MKRLVGILLVLLVFLQYKLWYGDSGFRKIQDYERRITTHKKEIQAVKDHNAALQAEVDDLKNGLTAIEERARRDLGMIRKNETFFQIIEPAPK
ncbi:MAG: cell division protein FtsB [Methylococcales bacterium]